MIRHVFQRRFDARGGGKEGRFAFAFFPATTVVSAAAVAIEVLGKRPPSTAASLEIAKEGRAHSAFQRRRQTASRLVCAHGVSVAGHDDVGKRQRKHFAHTKDEYFFSDNCGAGASVVQESRPEVSTSSKDRRDRGRPDLILFF